ncbi:YdcF family protein [Belnapia sp. T6]|uniref:YdcF family protein n=1 Tax=Belnapia mucosa TaxID=2804532 RepID=A0ABS1V212_9PROT|nr:YdcF family protein [Belnapia mucosa]MBL6455740.1 YdcF family protein [Belnapia mucosa]
MSEALPRPRWRRRRRLLVMAPALTLGLLAAGFAWFLLLAGRGPAEPERHTDGIAVLTGGAERVETGLRLLREGRAERILVSGVHPQVTLADLARLGGQEPEALAGRVSLGPRATTTRGNAAEIAEWARAEHLDSLRVVTAGYHMPRALLELRRRLPEVALVAHPVVPATLRDPAAGGRARTWSLLAGEYLKFLAAWAGIPYLLGLPLDPPR